MKSILLSVLMSIQFLALGSWAQGSSTTEQIKQEIFQTAEEFKGQGDPDRSKQKVLEALVLRLLEANPQAPVAQRLKLLYGPWQQIWGPYDYKNNKRGVDPTLDANNIYQVVFEGGYYYNVNPTLGKDGKAKNTVLLRGAIKVTSDSSNFLQAKFTNLSSIKGLPPKGMQFWDLPALSEARNLPQEKRTIPPFLVRLFFGGGYLQEVYTDHDLRITFGTGEDQAVKNYIYIMKRVN